tara:strand:+ start:10528 stop:12537 length:2010 start_codon:yes stop_codon:yes gene_type:complete
MNATAIRWGIIGPGKIARKFAKGVSEVPQNRIIAAASRAIERSKTFLEEIGEPEAKAYGDYQSILEDSEVDAVYIATPHPMHAKWCIQAIRAGKHVLCEKPMTLNSGEAMVVLDEAKQSRVLFMEAFMYRSHPQTQRVVDLLRQGTIGDVRRIQAEFAFNGDHSADSRLMNLSLGGGSILDVGCYPISMARLIAGTSHGKPFLNPIKLQATGYLNKETGVDNWASALLRFPGGIIAEVFSGINVRARNECVITGTTGRITIRSPWFCNGETVVEHFSGETEVLPPINDRNLYSYEIETFARHIEDLSIASPAMSPEDSYGNMNALDRWREDVRLKYPSEIPSSDFPHLSGTPRSTPGDQIPSSTLPGLNKSLSRVVMGTSGKLSFANFAPLFDDFFERGGNAFDDGSIYRKWNRFPSAVGQWMKARGIREQCVIFDKGAHHPYNVPDNMKMEFEQSLANYQTDYLDGYVMHRDNPDVPVCEFVDVINGMIQRKQVSIYGLSNWTIPRLVEAIDYAIANDLAPPTLLSNQLSLARLVNPIWSGCLSASEKGMLEWLTENNFALLPWASQASGFFTEQSDANPRLANKNLVEGFYSEDNFERKKRCYELAGQRKVHPTNIALAWVLAQPFPTFPVIGPMTITETRTTIPAFSVKLTTEERDWLSLKTDILA